MVVADLNGTVGFYRDLLGFDVDAGAMTPEESGWAVVRSGDVVLLFQASTGWTMDLLPNGKVEAGGLVTYRIYVEDVVSLYERVRAHVSVVRQPGIGPGGTPEFSLRDCNGFVLTFIQAEND